MKKTIMLVLAGFLSLATYAQQTAPKQDSTKTTHSCPMHPEITGTEKDKCSKCKMALTPVKQYVCPMHADITSTKKDAKCSKCGMALKEAKPAHTKH